MTAEIDRAAAAAIEKHENLLEQKVLELLLGQMVARRGVRETRAILLQHARHLREFHT